MDGLVDGLVDVLTTGWWIMLVAAVLLGAGLVVWLWREGDR